VEARQFLVSGSQHQQGQYRDHHIPAEEAADACGEQVPDEAGHIEPVLGQPWQEL
jgi:hypothetical protein